MPTIVNGHGSRDSDETTFVTPGVTVKFYSDFDVDLSSSVNLVALSQVSFDSPKEAIEGTGSPDDVANYKLTAEDDELIAAYYATTELQRYVDGALRDAANARPPILWVGADIPSGTRLCASPQACLEKGSHVCTGVLGRVKDEEIVILACRGIEREETRLTAEDIRALLEDERPVDELVAAAGESPLETHYGSDPQDPLYDLDEEKNRVVQEILALARTDIVAAETEADSYPQGSLAFFNRNKDYAAWAKARAAKDYAAAIDVEQFVGQLVSNSSSIERICDWFDYVPYYGETVDWLASGYREALVEEIALSLQGWGDAVGTTFTTLAERRPTCAGLLAAAQQVGQPAQSMPGDAPGTAGVDYGTGLDPAYDPAYDSDDDSDDSYAAPQLQSISVTVDIVDQEGRALHSAVKGMIHLGLAGQPGWLALEDAMLDLPAGTGYTVHTAGTTDQLITNASVAGPLNNLDFDNSDLHLPA